MKRFVALTLALLMVFLLVSCTGSGDDSPTAQSEPVRQEYILSDEVIDGSVIDGVMTDISLNDKILQRTPASWTDTCVLYEVNIRQYTEEGTFAAFENHLQRLKDMGINTLWFMPIHPISETNRKGSLGSYYAVSDYMGVNPEFGTIEDFRHLVDTAHSMGFKVILDWVANHTGWDHPWIREHDDWYVHKESGEIESPYDWTDVAKLDYNNYEMRAEMIKCMEYWVKDVGVDGFRCDHAIGVPLPFWNAAAYKLRSVNNDILMLAETSGTEQLTKYAFDSCYNESFYSEANMVPGGLDPSSVSEAMKLTGKYSDGSFPMNYLDNHDMNTYQGSVIYRLGDAYPPLLALSFIAPGMPLIYTTGEEEFDHEIEFFEKDTVTWEESPKYAPLITALAKLKVEYDALASAGKDVEILTPEHSRVFAMSRPGKSGSVVFVGNLYREKVEDFSFDCGFDSASCVIRYDGTKLDTTETQMTAEDFEGKDYEPYEFYVLIVK